MLRWRHPQLGDKSERFEHRLSKILLPWLGTPYHAGQQCAGAGVDCVRFVCAVLDDMYGRPRTPINTLPPDSALHDRAGAVAAMRRIRDLYMPNVPVEDEIVEPGDVLVVGPANGGPGHAMIVGPLPCTLWHSIQGLGVHTTGLVLGDQAVHRIYRMEGRADAC